MALEFSVVADSGYIEWRGGKLRNIGTPSQAHASTTSCRGMLVFFSRNTYLLQEAAEGGVCASLKREEMPHVTLP